MTWGNADITYALEQLLDRQKGYDKYRRYAEGECDLKFASASFRSTFGHLFRNLSYNKCGRVIDAFADRLSVTSWENENASETSPAEAGKSKRDPLEQAAIDIWTANTMRNRQREVHAEALQEGVSYVIVWPDVDTGEPIFAPNIAERVMVLFNDDNPTVIDVAVKLWQIERGEDKGRWRLTIYDDEHVARFISRNKAQTQPKTFAPFVPYEDDAPAEIPNLIGACPVVPFRNNPTTGSLGVSELRDLIPLQDGLNKSLADMMVGAEFQAYRQRWATGLEPIIDPVTGNEIAPFSPGADRIWAATSSEARFGEFDAADLTQYTQTQDSWELKIARTSGVPVHWLIQTGGFPSGESLKTAEDPFVKKAERQQRSFGESWKQAMRIALLQKGAAAEQIAGLSPIWDPAGSRSDLEFWQIAQLKAANGVSPAQIQAEYGYTPDEIAEFAKAAKAEADARLNETACCSIAGNCRARKDCRRERWQPLPEIPSTRSASTHP
jgi:hypothetical protein